MSHMEYAKGIAHELFNDIDGEIHKATALADSLGVKPEELFNTYNDDFEEFIDDYYDDYTFANGRLFDMKDVTIAEFEDEERDHVKYLGKGDYEVDFIYYNGGANFAEVFQPWLEKQERGEADIEKYFVKFDETNDHEGERWTFWLQLDGNENELKELDTWLNTFDADEEGWLNLDMKTCIPESHVDILVEHSHQGYMKDHNKVVGKFTCPGPTDEEGKDGYQWLNDTFYKGDIKMHFRGQ